ncbi:HCL457Cp [Eremothecium sinecaudum]|uniref:HCL457Cp n=1 Tax=Eremothecium sinecaudum TaxID=45286 RepID=A0A120K1S6_9SACH|nr:HCL457Cp [Eremothecium sinecaudum]AMD19694.1 HCL457Cp [Eremothecium sinecaudum]
MSFYTDGLLGADNGRGSEAHARQGSSNSEVRDDANVTPMILLEQLAYVDNFMTDLDNDFLNLDVLLDSKGDTVSNGLSLDERLAAELSAFADDSFIFPDEDKPDANDFDVKGGSMSHDDVGKPDAREPMAAPVRPSQLLTERRNNLFSSQYDYTRQRISKRGRQEQSQSSPVDDHGSFNNLEVPNRPANGVYDSLGLSELLKNPNVVPSVPSYPATAATVGSSSQYPQRKPNINLPDYSTIPTSTIVALLPKAVVPPGAYNSLLHVGFSKDQIDAVAAIMAYHQTKGPEAYNSTLSAVVASANNTLNSSSESLQYDQGAGSYEAMSYRSVPQAHAKDSSSEQFFSEYLTQDNGQSHKNSALYSGSSSDQNEKLKLRKEEESSKPPALSSSEESIKSDSRTQSTNKLTTAGTEQDSLLENASCAGSLFKATMDDKASKMGKSHSRRKKKELELENSVKELGELATTLKQKIQTLEMENRLLKNIVAEKGENEGKVKGEEVRRQILSKIRDEK